MDDFDPVSHHEYLRLMGILSDNSGKPFVQRILNPAAYPSLDMGGGQVATHRMAWGKLGNQFLVYPTVLPEGDGLKDYGDAAFNEVLRSGDYIKFDSEKDADWFSKRYKGAWGGRMNEPPR